MIECKKVSFSYPPNETDIGDRKGHGTLRNIDLSINDGDFVLLCGTSGCGKTTLTRLFNGLIPHYYDGKLEGTVMLDGEDMIPLPVMPERGCLAAKNSGLRLRGQSSKMPRLLFWMKRQHSH